MDDHFTRCNFKIYLISIAFQNLHQNQLCTTPSTSQGNGNTRRHTVGPGDVAHEHALQDTNVIALNFKYEPSKDEQQSYPYPPINLPTLQNQPLHYLTTKDQHLLKPPLVMGASKYTFSRNKVI